MRTDPAPSGARAIVRAVALLLAPLLLVACSGSERVDWPGVRFTLPDGWEVLVEERERLVVADHRADDGERGVLVTFVTMPGTFPAEWRERIAQRGATLESDVGVLIAGDVPATQLILVDEVDGIPVREAILVVSSRELVISVLPRLQPGDEDGLRILLDSLDDVRALLDTVDLPPPAVR